jgi:hypothetical protein
MAARYVMDREEAARMLRECKNLWYGKSWDGKMEILRMPKTGGPEAELMAAAGGNIACWSKEDNGFVGVAELQPLGDRTLDSFGDAKKPIGLPSKPIARFASVSLSRAFLNVDEAKWMKMSKTGGCRVERVIRVLPEGWQALIQKAGGLPDPEGPGKS